MAKYINSQKTKEMLKISDCDLMHLRESGKLSFEKKKNAYFYFLDEVKKHIKVKK